MTKRVVIKKENLPNINVLTKKYNIRYRIITNDRNRTSYWSPIYSVDPENIYVPSGEILIEKHTGYSTLVWNPVVIKKNVDGDPIDFRDGDSELKEYDIWIRWGTSATDGEWKYKERISSSSLNVLKPTEPAGINHISVEIYRPGQPTLRKATYDINQSNSAGKINLTTDVITLPENVFKTGYPIKYESTNAVGGLTSGTTYYARMITATTMTLHPTKNDSINNTNKIDITSNTNAIGFFTWEDCTVCDFLLYAKYNFSPV
jgi:hypothetical protein